MQFNKLGDTNFPYLENADPYAFRNEFDYTRWTPDTKVKLVNVLWNSDYEDVVKFGSDADRDNYFAKADGKWIELTSNQTITPDGTVRVPLPYDVASRYNYIVVKNPMITPDGKPVEHEDSYGVRNWYFFIDSCTYAAPSNTILTISLDVWTNFINDVDIMYMMLARGHAPVAATNTDNYLANPLVNNRYLLAPDVNYSSQSIVSDARFQPIGSGVKYVCLASTVSPSQIASLGSVTGDGTGAWGRPTYSDSGSREGYQLVVNGLSFTNGYDYSGLRTPTANGNNSSDLIPNNLHVYAVLASDGSFFSDLMKKSPQFLNTVKACYMLSSDMITIGTKRTIAGHDAWDVKPVHREFRYKLTKDMFNYPDRYKRYAKLYTMPYASVELCDSGGESINIAIESMGGNVKMVMESCAAFPYINFRSYLAGIASDSTYTVTWKRLDGSDLKSEIDNGDWRKYCIDMNIPTYALYMDGATSHMIGNYNRNYANAARSALVGYHTSVRSANTAMQNAIDSSNTARSNVSASMSTMVSNNDNTCNTNRANMDLTIATNSANTARNNTAGVMINSYSANMAYAERIAANACMVVTTKEENEVTTSTTSNSGINGIGSGAVSGAMSGAAMGSVIPGVGTAVGAVGGALIGAASAGVSAMTNNANATIITNANTQITNAAITKNNQTYQASITNSMSSQAETNNAAVDITNNNNACSSQQTNNNNSCARTNTSNSANTGNANAERTRGTENANSGYTRGVAVANAKEILENQLNLARATYNDARNAHPVTVCSESGDPAMDAYANRGVSLKVRTQPESAIAQAGDTFARYGYALNQVWDVAKSGLNLMKHFTYWQSEDIWVDDRRSSNNNVNAMLSAIFNKGVTVWRKPTEIGKVSIYDN